MEDSLSHYGVPGMKWGVRKDRKNKNDSYNRKYLAKSPGAVRTKATTKNGDTIQVVKKPLHPMAAMINRKLGRDPGQVVATMEIQKTDGTKVGSFQVWREPKNPRAVRGEWLQIDAKHQGNGYSAAALDALIKQSKKRSDIDEVRLMVPTSAAPAKHIYEKLGFKFDEDLSMGLEDWVLKVNK